MGRSSSATAAGSGPGRCCAIASCCRGERGPPAGWGWAGSAGSCPTAVWAEPRAACHALGASIGHCAPHSGQNWPKASFGLALELADHVVGPGVVAEPLLVADDLLAVGPLQGHTRRRLAVVGLDLEPGPVPGGRLLLDRDPVAAGLVLERVELVRGDREDELPREPAGLALAELVSGAIRQGTELKLADGHLRPGSGRPEGAD